jgi:hypothetical protein
MVLVTFIPYKKKHRKANTGPSVPSVPSVPKVYKYHKKEKVRECQNVAPILAHQQRIEAQREQELLNISAHEYLRSLYQDPNQPTSLRLRAAIKAIEVETPKMSAVAIATMDGKSFAEALDRCIERSKGPPRLNGPVEELPASELKKPMSRYRRF